MHRFYFPNANFSQPHLEITDPREIHHAKNVLRLKKEDAIHFFNDQSEEGEGVIKEISSGKIKIEIKSVTKQIATYPHITLACALPKKSKFEIIVEKATELGADEIVPLKTARTEIKITSENMNKKIVRFETVAMNAVKQSQRAKIPRIHPVTDLRDAFKNLSQNSTCLIPSLEEKSLSLKEALSMLKNPKNLSIFIGPEGDFTPEEYALARKQGAIAVTLGKNILKVETAAIATLSFTKLFFSNNY